MDARNMFQVCHCATITAAHGSLVLWLWHCLCTENNVWKISVSYSSIWGAGVAQAV
jgi:hypothetical protein